MEQFNQNYKGKLAVITGASSGIGLAMAHVFAEKGFNLLVVSDHENIFITARDLAVHGTMVDAHEADLSKDEGVQSLINKMVTYGEQFHSIVLNAGVGVGGAFIETELEKEMNLIQLNIVSLIKLTKHILPDFVKNNEGRILFTSSIAAEMPGPYYAVYAASKAFVQSFSEAIRFELNDMNKNNKVVITALQPGATDTNFFARAEMLDTKAGRSHKKDDPRDVALDGFNALMEGKDHVVAGSFKNKVQSTLSRIMPEKMQAKAHAMDTKPDSLKH